jgi:hypothetical protein
MPSVFLQILIKHGLNLRMSFILTVLGQLFDPLATVARDVLLKKSFKEPLIFGLPFFFLPT